ncbi:MAG: hypothetical protein PVH25_08215 [Burkholderiales bacterium]|jgi:hypothetical protein
MTINVSRSGDWPYAGTTKRAATDTGWPGRPTSPFGLLLAMLWSSFPLGATCGDGPESVVPTPSSYAHRPGLWAKVLEFVISERRAITSPKNQPGRQNRVFVMGQSTRFDADQKPLTLWIFAQYACKPRDFTIFLPKVYDFFRTNGIIKWREKRVISRQVELVYS